MDKRRIFITYGRNPGETAKSLLDASGLAELVHPGLYVALKPNLVVAKPAASGATTHPEILAAVIEFLQDCGVRRIAIMEGSWLGEDTSRAFRICGYEELSRQYNVPLIDLKQDEPVRRRVGDLVFDVCKSPLEADLLVNLPVVKAHCQTGLTCALKNLKGCLPDHEKRRFHRLGLHRPIAALATLFPSTFILADGICGDLSFEEGGHPVPMDRLLAGRDPVLVDAYAARLIGLEMSEVPYIALAEELGAGSADLEAATVVENNLGDKQAGKEVPRTTGRKFSHLIDERLACSACYGSLLFALERLESSGKLRNLPGKIAVGQGFRNVSGAGVGCGRCTSNLTSFVDGCPPTAREIRNFLENLIASNGRPLSSS